MEAKRFRPVLLKFKFKKAAIAALALVVCLGATGVVSAEYTLSDRFDDFTHNLSHYSSPNEYRTKTLWATIPIMGAMAFIVSDVIGNTIGPILKPLEQIAGISIKIDGEYGQIKEMIKTYNDNYKKDHNDLDEGKRISVEWDAASLRSNLESAGAISFAATADRAKEMLNEQNPGYRTVSAGKTVDYASVYRERAAKWQNMAFGMLTAANSEARNVTSAQNDIKSMNDTSNEADGYMQIIQAGSQERNYLNRNLVQARFDVMMQIDLQFKNSMEKIQDDADSTSAFDQAVRTWVSPGGTRSY
jgi:hypothetical protein